MFAYELRHQTNLSSAQDLTGQCPLNHETGTDHISEAWQAFKKELYCNSARSLSELCSVSIFERPRNELTEDRFSPIIAARMESRRPD